MRSTVSQKVFVGIVVAITCTVGLVVNQVMNSLFLAGVRVPPSSVWVMYGCALVVDVIAVVVWLVIRTKG